LRRILRPEILDSNNSPAAEVKQSLIDLQRINRWFGGVSTTQKLIDIVIRETGKKELTLLDVGSATGDIPSQIANQLRIRLRYTLLDRDPTHLPAGATRVRADALALPFCDNSFDLVTCSLFAHHLEPDQLTSFAQEALRVCRVALLINDLRRSYLHLFAIHAGALRRFGTARLYSG